MLQYIAIALFIMTFIAIIIMCIQEANATHIGVQGAHNQRKEALFNMFIGICAFCGLMFNMIHYRMIRHIVWEKEVMGIYLFFVFLALLCVIGGILMIIRLEQEKWSEVKVSTLIDCKIEHHATFRHNYYMVKGTSLEHNGTCFCFRGADRKIIQEFQRQNANALVIHYYAKNEHMQNVNIIA